MPDPTRKSFIINEGLRIRDQHEIALDFITLDQPINQLGGDLPSFKYSALFAMIMMVMAKFLFSIYIPTIIQGIAVLVMTGISAYLLFYILETFNGRMKDNVYSTLFLYVFLGVSLLTLLGLF